MIQNATKSDQFTPKLNDWMRHIAMNYVNAVLIQMYINWKLAFSGKSSFQIVVYATLKVV